MGISGIMAFLADNYIYGISVSCVVVISMYLAFSIRLIVTARRVGMNICASAMIPIYNIVLWVKKCIVKHRASKPYGAEEEIEL